MQTALISAGTAAFVTLLIEFAAKPRLEARKDRVVEEHRRRRELLSRINALHARAIDLSAPSPDAPDRDRAQAIATEFINEFKKLQIDVHETGHTLHRWQRQAFRGCILNIIFVLSTIEAIAHDKGLLEIFERARNLGVDLSVRGPDPAKMIDFFLVELSNAHYSLVPEPWWNRSYHRYMKRLAHGDKDRYRRAHLPDNKPT